MKLHACQCPRCNGKCGMSAAAVIGGPVNGKPYCDPCTYVYENRCGYQLGPEEIDRIMESPTDRQKLRSLQEDHGGLTVGSMG